MINEKEEGLVIPKGSINRRGFMKTAGVTGLAVAAGATMVGKLPKVLAAGNGINDFDILNFALNLEYLEAEFYTVATTGKTLAQTGGFTLNGTGTRGMTSGGNKVDFSGTTSLAVAAIAAEIAADEQTHVKYIQAAIGQFGGQFISEPSINLDALGTGFESVAAFLTVARALEDIGVSAYGGAAPLINNRTVLGAAARILATEAEHSGNIRLQVATLNIPTSVLDGVDILPPPSGSKYFSVTDSSAQTQIRTPGQVLFLAYGFKANTAAGGFFPGGVNGKINMSSTAA